MMMGPYLAMVESVPDVLLSARSRAGLPSLEAATSEPAATVHAAKSAAADVGVDEMAEATGVDSADVGVDESAEEAGVESDDVGVDDADADADEADDGPSKRLIISCGASSGPGLFTSSSARTVRKSAAASSVLVSDRS
jgi:hypothetical protein